MHACIFHVDRIFDVAQGVPTKVMSYVGAVPYTRKWVLVFDISGLGEMLCVVETVVGTELECHACVEESI